MKSNELLFQALKPLIIETNTEGNFHLIAFHFDSKGIKVLITTILTPTDFRMYELENDEFDANASLIETARQCACKGWKVAGKFSEYFPKQTAEINNILKTHKFHKLD